MKVRDKVIVVTGGASGIGRALAERFAAEGARSVVVADLDEAGASLVASSIGGGAVAAGVDVADEQALVSLIDEVEESQGPIDLFCSNAGVFAREGLETTDERWDHALDVNLRSHLFAARHLVPRMTARGGGYLLHTASAAGLLSQIGSVTYAVTKAAVVALAEWIAITHGDDGIRVSVLCPQAVRTPMLTGGERSVAAVDGVIEPEAVAEAVIRALAEERFLVLPHPEVAEYVRRKGEDRERWLAGMRRLQARFEAG
ncbi:MAG TPA: SDR family oxidoreductase [Longimicrobiales bacterium]|nr:SDR family oxidoreductase [Longimicrobiales bacterium]